MSDAAKEIFTILSNLVAIPSVYPPGNTKDLCDYIKKFLDDCGYETKLISQDGIVYNVIAKLSAKGNKKPQLAFNCHIDTVDIIDRSAWLSDPYVASLRDGRVYGLGANNCKGPAAVQMYIAKEIAKQGITKGELVFTFCGDEEALGTKGTELLRVEKHIEPDMLVVGAQTENALITRERGVSFLELMTYGKNAHAGEPSQGDNAIMRMMRLISVIEKELLGEIEKRNFDGLQSTLSIGVIQGGTNPNVVPSSCKVLIDRRFLPKSESLETMYNELLATLEKAGEPKDSYKLTLLTGTNGFSAPTDGVLVSSLLQAVKDVTKKEPKIVDCVGAFDGRFFANDGIEIVNFGAGEGNEGHKDNESINLEQMVESADIQLELIKKVLN